LCVGLPALGAAQDPISLRGVVRDSWSGLGIAAVELTLVGSPGRVLTNERGEFLLLAATGAGPLHARRLGYHPAAVTLTGGMADAPFEIRLAPSAQALSAVVVRADRAPYSGRLAGYYERLARHSGGVFITRADIEREQPPQLTDMLQRAPGIHVARGRPGAPRIQMRGRECVPLIWLDGTALSSGNVDLDAFSPNSLEGVEMYLGAVSAPSRFQAARGRSDCGTILLWTRGPESESPRLRPRLSMEQLDDLVRSATVFTADQVDTVASLESIRSPAAYPSTLRAAGVAGRVVTEFVVDTTGDVESESFTVVSETHPLFSASARAAVLGASYRPAVRGGRRVRQVVRQPFEFQVPPDAS
jgi:TonB family protein